MESGQATGLVVERGERDLPEGSFTVEAWVRIDKSTRWGTIFGYQQDNGSYEKGWSLGYEGSQFVMRASDGPKLRLATGAGLNLGTWHHVVGVFDADRREIRIHVDGKKGGSASLGGAIEYPDIETHLTLGCYLDKDENYPLEGRIREVRLYDEVLKDSVITAHVEWAEKLADKALEFSVRPGIRFLTPTSAEVRWETSLPGGAAVAYGLTRKLGQVVQSEAAGTSHRVVLTGLEPGRDYHYRFGHIETGQRLFSPFYLLEGKMNYTISPLPDPEVATAQAAVVDRIVKALHQPGGIAVVVGDPGGTWTEAIAARSELAVIAVAGDEDGMQALRQRWYAQGKYGERLSVQGPDDELPDGFADLVFFGPEATAEEGSIAALSATGLMASVSVAVGIPGNLERLPAGDGLTLARRNPGTRSVWNHQYGGPESRSYVDENLGGIDRTDQLDLAWLGRPGADFGIDRQPRMPAPLVINGRVFHQGMNRMIALNAFNGSVLWSLEIPDLRRLNVPRDCSNWCADPDHVYTAVKDRLWVIDAATGRMESALTLPESLRAGREWGFVAVADGVLLGSSVTEGAAFEAYWTKSGWFEGNDAAGAAKVCSGSLFARSPEDGKLLWEWAPGGDLRPGGLQSGVVINSTITVAGGRIFCVVAEGIDPTGPARQEDDVLWNAPKIVCLDLQSGKPLWVQNHEAMTADPLIAFGLCADGKFLLELSGEGKFHFATFDVESGSPDWTASVAWPHDHHSGHMQHAVAMNGQLLVQPHILSLADGSVQKSGTLGKRRGCATPVGFDGGIFFRGGGGALSIWSLEQETRTGLDRVPPELLAEHGPGPRHAFCSRRRGRMLLRRLDGNLDGLHAETAGDRSEHRGQPGPE